MKNLSDMTDEQLALSYINGSNEAFDLLLLRNQSKLFSYILFVVHDQDAANDLFQETFVKVITRLQQGKYSPTGKFYAWIMRIAHNVIMDWYRAQRADKIVDAPKENNLSNIAGSETTIGDIECQFINTQTLSETTGVSINRRLGRMRYAILNLRRMVREYNLNLQFA